MTKLKPCPFCGSKAKWDKYWQSISCTVCGIRTSSFGGYRNAVETWNNRPNPWHTGTPTEEGWYVLHYPKCKEKPLELAKWNGSKFVAVEPFHAIIVYIEADTVPLWQKIEIPPFEASTETRSYGTGEITGVVCSGTGCSNQNENIFDKNGKVKADYAEALNKNMLYNVCRYQAENKEKA